MQIRFTPVVFAAIAAGVLLAACGGDDEGGPPRSPAANARTITVTAADFSFDNTNLTAKAGEEIQLDLDNTGSAEHSFTIDNVVDVEAEGGEQKSAGFKAPSQTAPFRCKYHPEKMKGTLTISG